MALVLAGLWRMDKNLLLACVFLMGTRHGAHPLIPSPSSHSQDRFERSRRASWDTCLTAAINVNAANLSKLVPTDPSTYASGYPPVYTTASRNPTNINITSKGFENFKASDDMPAVIYSTGCLDIHGNCNISGVLYTPCYVEMENLKDGQIQYIKGMVIMGSGMYYKNTKAATNIISYDTASVDSLATFGNSGKQVTVSYWEP